jgi:hypothetical protein
MEIKSHPIYEKYGSNEVGEIYNIKKQRIIKQTTDKYGYKYVGIRKDNKMHTVRSSRFIYECFNGIIGVDLCIDHINNKREDNRLVNLQTLTQSENCLKKFTSGYIQHNLHKKRILCIDVLTKEESIYGSIYGAGKILNIVPASINRVCKGMQHTAISKNTQKKYNFKIL